MKKIIIGVMSIMTFGFVSGQESDKEEKEIKTLFSGVESTGFYFGYKTKIGDLNGESSLMLGGELAMVMSSKFNVGFVGYGLITNVDADTYAGNAEKLSLHFGYGGFLLDPVIASKSMVHITVPVIVGVGYAGVHLKEEFFKDFGKEDYEYESKTDAILVVEPGMNVEINLFKHVRLGLGASYRYVYDSNVNEISDEELSGMSGNVSLKFGWF
jgi:hypothetical protein